MGCHAVEVMSLLCDSNLFKKESCSTDLYLPSPGINQTAVCSYSVSLHYILNPEAALKYSTVECGREEQESPVGRPT